MSVYVYRIVAEPTHLDVFSLALQDVSYEGHEVGGVGGVLQCAQGSVRSKGREVDANTLLRCIQRGEHRLG